MGSLVSTHSPQLQSRCVFPCFISFHCNRLKKQNAMNYRKAVYVCVMLYVLFYCDFIFR